MFEKRMFFIVILIFIVYVITKVNLFAKSVIIKEKNKNTNEVKTTKYDFKKITDFKKNIEDKIFPIKPK